MTELPLKTRSMLNLAMISVLNRPNELRTHIKAALTNGVTRDEIREIFLQVAIYAGVPAAVDSFRIAGEVFNRAGRGLGARRGGRIYRPGKHGISHGAPAHPEKVTTSSPSTRAAPRSSASSR